MPEVTSAVIEAGFRQDLEGLLHKVSVEMTDSVEAKAVLGSPVLQKSTQ